jgi:CRISPR-associated protein Csx10
MIITIKMLSDWHVGSGTGRPGSIDRLIQRDSHDLPYIPAKTLTGILRDGCELVAAGLDEGNLGVWHDCLEYLFGSQPALADPTAGLKPPIPAALNIRSAHFPQFLQLALSGCKELKSAITFVKPGVAIDERTGTAKTECLRFEEMARGGCTLESEYTLDLSNLTDSTQLSVAALLQAGAAMVTQLGAKRRRGAGKCQISWSGLPLDLTAAINHLENCPAPEWPKQIEKKPFDLQSPKTANWCSFELQLTTISPLIIHAKTVGNQINTLDYIPGTQLLPIVAKTLAPLMEDIGSAIGNSQLIVTNATIELDEQRSRPTPFALFQEKQAKDKIHNRIGSNVDLDNLPQLKGMRSGYLTEQGIFQTVSTSVNTHNTITDKYQRPTQDEGGVYSYGSIPPDTKFRAIIHIQDSSLNKSAVLNAFQKLQTTKIQIGRSKKDDYGAVQLSSVQEITNTESDLKDIGNGEELKVWLLSDVLIRNDRLRPSTDPKDFIRVLAQELGVEIEELSISKKDTFSRSKRTDSWHSRWNRPRPSLIGLSAGSCFLLKVKSPISAVALRRVEHSGIGERRAEGYGQICFNSELLMKNDIQLTKDSSIPPPHQLVDIDVTQLPYSQIIQKAAWRAAIQRRAASLNALERKELIGVDLEKLKPSMSQLSNLRSIVMSHAASNLATEAQSWIKKVPDTVKNNWPDKMAAITTLFEKPERIWQILDIETELQSLTISNDGVETMKKLLWAETVRIVVMESILSHKRASENVRGVQNV